MGRLDLARHGTAAVVAITVAVLSWFWAEQPWISLALSLGAAVLTLQTVADWRRQTVAEERLAVLELLREASPLISAGESLQTAVQAAARHATASPVVALRTSLQRISVGQTIAKAAEAIERWPLLSMLFRLIVFQRDQGGDPAPLVAALRRRLELSADLARKRDLALVQIQWQANAITVFFIIVLGAALLRAGPFLTALIETIEGRGLVAGSAALVIWGRVALNRLAERLQ